MVLLPVGSVVGRLEKSESIATSPPNPSLHIRHVATHKERRGFPVFAQRRVGITRPRNDPRMFDRQPLSGPYRPVFRLLLGWPKDGLNVAGLVTIKGGDND